MLQWRKNVSHVDAIILYKLSLWILFFVSVCNAQNERQLQLAVHNGLLEDPTLVLIQPATDSEIKRGHKEKFGLRLQVRLYGRYRLERPILMNENILANISYNEAIVAI